MSKKNTKKKKKQRTTKCNEYNLWMHAKKCCSRRFGAFPSYLEHFYHCLLLNSLYKFVSFVFLTVSDEEGGQRQPSVRHRDANADLVKLARVSITEYHSTTLMESFGVAHFRRQVTTHRSRLSRRRLRNLTECWIRRNLLAEIYDMDRSLPFPLMGYYFTSSSFSGYHSI